MDGPREAYERGVTKMADESFRGARVRSLPKPNRSYGTGRVCKDPTCGTKLSRYNRWDFCWQHEPVHSYTPRGRRKKHEAA
jgi:hypothetical protein